MTEDIVKLGSAGFRYAKSSSNATLNVVFVHGFRGNEIETWTWRAKGQWYLPWKSKPPGILLQQLLHAHGDISCNQFSLAHKASITSPTDIESASGVLRTFLESYVLRDSSAPVVLIAHSFGGLACREAILRMLELPGQLPIVGLLLMGTPNSGAQIARAAALFGSGSGGDMEPYNDRLAMLNREWTAKIVNGGDPDRDASTRAPLVCWSAVGTEDRVVPRASAASMASFADVKYISKGHIDLPKAPHRHDPSFVLINSFLKESERFARQRDGEWAIKEITHRLRRASLNNPWVKRDEIHMRLRNSDIPHQFACRIANKLEGGLQSRRFSFCIWQSKLKLPSIPIHFDWEIGRGSMNETAFARMIEENKAALEQYFRVTRLEVHQQGRKGTFIRSGFDSGPGWFVFHYDAPEWFEASIPYDTLEIEVETYTDRRQGWMHYAVERTITERLVLSFTAPFRFNVIAHLGKSNSQDDVEPSGDDYIYSTTVDGPVALDRSVVWIYQNLSAHT